MNAKFYFLITFCAVSFLIIFSSTVKAEPNACLQCHGNQAPLDINNGRAPVWPDYFSMDWKMYEFKSAQRPPFKKIPAIHKMSRGKTYYDWSEMKMTEIYYDRCINIFSEGNDFSCQFLSYHNKTYFIKFKLGDLDVPQSCCLWSDSDFFAPRPDVLRNMRFQKEFQMDKKKVEWWISDIPPPGPFGYGTIKGTSQPVAFWFPVIDAWVQQNFSNYSTERPSSKVFDLPSLCHDPLDFCKSE